MNDQQKIIKDDINFLEYSNWTISKKKKVTMWTIKKPQGKYEIMCPIGVPKHFDKIVLYSLLDRLYREKKLNSYVLITTRYEIAKNIFDRNHFGKNIYTRIRMSLKKWASLLIDFDGLFFDGNGYTSRVFHILDEVVLQKETGELKIKFNESYITQLNESKFYKFIDFEKYKKLHKASSARLYEILVKNYKERDEWAIGIQLLAEKLTFEKREGAQSYYPSDVLRYLKPSINEINKKTDLEIGFNYNKETGTCIFKKLKKQKNTFIAATKDNTENKKAKQDSQKEIAACMAYFNSLEESEKQRIRNKAIHDPLLVVLATEQEKIYGYMTNSKQWQPLK